MKILVTGANGMLAQAVRERFAEEELILTDVNVKDTSIIKELDITNLENLQKFVEDCKPDVIINCAAYTAVDNAENDLEMARRINAEGPKNLAIAAKKVGSILVHVSTDYVFGGDLDLEKCYSEDDEKNPQTVYGTTKLEGEEAIAQCMEEFYIFRTAWLYGLGKNFVRTMLRVGNQNNVVNVVHDQHGSPTYTVDLANIIADSLQKEIPYGIYHATNLGFTTWFDFTKKIYELADIDCEVNPVTTEEFPRPAKRPANSKLSKEKLESVGIQIPNWEDALKRYLEIEI